ncbi:hypothetical protein [Brevibacillus choshinensis]|uniref:Transposase n=1 Tax=Brevibacillus choshinensis TaxID=54911 RepID=A0ABX7FID0_BRECH|nr:hypothetical protein [Brevibacillus choshinensis]QRG65974.1 hypothetical protein JNE38_20670 [Brevibacillus choshinensis]
MFTIKGKYNGKETEVTWDNGTLTGDDFLVRSLHCEADAMEGHLVAFPTMVGTTHNHLQDPLSSLYLILEQFEEVYESHGDVPQLPDVPDGAIS